MSPSPYSSSFINHFLISICALPSDAPPVVALASGGKTTVPDDFLMYNDSEYCYYEYTVCDPDDRVTAYVLDDTYCCLLRSLHKWLCHLAKENSLPFSMTLAIGNSPGSTSNTS